MNEMILYWNRSLQREEEEKVYGDAAVRLLYGNPFGFQFADHVLALPFISRIYGAFQNSSLSRNKIPAFVETFQIPMQDFESGPFRSFNEFFVRRFLPGKRPFEKAANRMPAFAEARYLAFSSVTDKSLASVKGISLSPLDLLKNTPGAERFLGGPCLLARLCPVDYHRFHFPDDGRVVHSHTEQGKLHSVNPIALTAKPDIFLTNERTISLLETKNFGCLAFVEVGALCVGKIVQTYGSPEFQRGAEKGYFLFGASTVIVLGEPCAWTPDQDLLDHSAKGKETLVRLGEALAQRR